MRAKLPIRAITGIFLIFLLLFSTFSRSQAQENYTSSTSWALGVVIPQGAKFSDGSTLNWQNTNNVTVVFTLPNISQPDNIVYAVLSVMTNDSDVLQIAAGVFPNNTMWLVYSWIFTDLTSNPVKYQWILNSSLPEMSPNDNIAMSIFLSKSNWELSVVDLNTGSYVSRAFPSGIATLLRAGDQEVFALESYSRSATTFQDMGNFTLNSLLIDGNGISSGYYLYDGGWNPTHNPLFVIGSIGQTPPTFITVESGIGDSLVWSYTNPWLNSQSSYPVGIETISLIAVLIGLIIIASAVAVMKISKRNEVENR